MDAEAKYEPQQLWLIPIHLRARYDYYREADEAARHAVEEQWRLTGYLHESREAFEASDLVCHIRSSRSPYWWGLHDIVGFIDVRMNIPEWEFQVSLFLPDRRVSRTLRKKNYVLEYMERVAFPSGEPNSVAQEQIVAAIESMARHKSIKKRHLDLDPWKRMVRNMDLVGVFNERVSAMVASRGNRTQGPG